MAGKELPNGFTGFSKRDPGFESAADALRKAERRSGAGTSGRQADQIDPSIPYWQPPSAAASNDAPARQSAYPSASIPQSADADAQVLPLRELGGDLRPRNSQRPAHHYSANIERYLRPPDVIGGESSYRFDYEKLKDIAPADHRWAWVEIDLNAIYNNALAIKRSLAPGTKMLAIVKADGYGHGAVESANAAIRGGADYLGVSNVDEGIELREAGITAPILILAQPPISSIPMLLAYNLMPSIYMVEFALQYGEAADVVGMSAPFHLKINTGMNRIGVRYDEVIDFLQRIAFHRALDMVGVFTHFATADDPEEMEFRIQLAHMNEALEAMRSMGVDPGIVHTANSAAILKYPEAHFDMVRAGIALYGHFPSYDTFGSLDLQPAMSVHAKITQVKNVPVGEGVSYGLLHRSGGFNRICTIPIGYADGLQRGLSGITDIIYNGKQYPQVGAICMDQTMFEVDLRTRRSSSGTGKVDPQVADEVIVVGAQGNAVITIDEMAEKLGTVPHEVLIGFGTSRMPRIYK